MITVQYSRPKTPDRNEIGYIAEEIDSLGLTNLIHYDVEGLPDDVKYDRMVLYLVEIIKMHEKRFSKLESQFSNLKSKHESLMQNQRRGESDHSGLEK